MQREDTHPTDQELLLEVEGELSPADANRVQEHITACWKCRARKQELEHAIADFVRVHHGDLDARLPAATGPRALLKAQLSQVTAETNHGPGWFWLLASAACGLLALGIFLSTRSAPQQVIVSLPNTSLTPGATVLVGRREICGVTTAKNKAVPVSLQRKVFEAYGIANAEPRAYEVDYLITPALGGADDIRNLWPQSYHAAVWNARVKDDLEDRLRELVCDGSVDLTSAQREIAMNWIAAYKKYFHTDKPLQTEPRQ